MSTEKEIILLTLLPLWRTCKTFFCSLEKRKGIVLHKNIRGPVQVPSKMMVWAIKKFMEFFTRKKKKKGKNSVAHKRLRFFAGKKKLGTSKRLWQIQAMEREKILLFKNTTYASFYFIRQRHLNPVQQPRSHQGEFSVGCYGLQSK